MTEPSVPAARSNVAAIILAAGLGSRFRAEDQSIETKLVARMHEKAVVRFVAEAALASRAQPVIVVTGHAAAAVERELSGLPLTFAHNADYATGLASSLRTGVAHAPADAKAVLILLGDMPSIAAGLIDATISLFERRPDASAVAPSHAGVRGNPVLLSRSLFPQIERLSGDQGARRLLDAAGADVIEWDSDASVGLDIDTPDALRQAASLPLPRA